MKQLTNKQLEFLNFEFGIKDVNYNSREEIVKIRELCFEIEVDETEDHIDDPDLGARGNMAVSIVNDLFVILREHKTKTV